MCWALGGPVLDRAGAHPLGPPSSLAWRTVPPHTHTSGHSGILGVLGAVLCYQVILSRFPWALGRAAEVEEV